LSVPGKSIACKDLLCVKVIHQLLAHSFMQTVYSFCVLLLDGGILITNFSVVLR